MTNVTPILFDNSVFRRILKKNKTSNDIEYIRTLSEYLRSNFNPPFVRITTPFLHLEVLGISVEAKPPEFCILPSFNFAEELDIVLKYSIDFFSSQEYLSAECIRKKYLEQLNHFSDDQDSIEFLKDTIGRITEVDGFEETIHSWLGFDHTIQRSNWTNDSHTITQQMVFDAFHSFSYRYDLPLFRLANRVYIETEQALQKLVKEGKKTPDVLHPRPFKIESRQDYVDMDLLHYAVMGLSERSGSRAVVVTHDDYIEVFNRLVWYKTFICHLISLLDSQKVIFPIPTPSHGSVLVLNHASGEIIEHIDVSLLQEGKYLFLSK